MKPLCIDLFCGLGGWSEGFLAEGYWCVGFDIERHDYGAGGYPGDLVLQDILTIHGSQFKDAAIIVASPPCQEFSYMAMPWSRGKQIKTGLHGQGEFPEGYKGSRTVAELTALFQACFRIQHEACEAAGRYIPMVVENVRGAQPWVGRSAWNYGSFHLWGDVPALMPFAYKAVKNPGVDWSKYGEPGYVAVGFNMESERRLRDHERTRRTAVVQNLADAADGQKLSGNNGPRTWSEREVQRLGDAQKTDGMKVTGQASIRNGHSHTRHLTNQREHDEAKGDGTKHGGDCFSDPNWPGRQGGCVRQAEGKGLVIGGGTHHLRGKDDPAKHWSGSNARKAASALIAKIPLDLSTHIARVYKPRQEEL